MNSLNDDDRASLKDKKKDELIEIIESCISDRDEANITRDKAMRELRVASEERNLAQARVGELVDVVETSITQLESVGRYAGQVIHWDPENERSWERHQINLEDYAGWQESIQRTLEMIKERTPILHSNHVHTSEPMEDIGVIQRVPGLFGG